MDGFWSTILERKLLTAKKNNEKVCVKLNEMKAPFCYHNSIFYVTHYTPIGGAMNVIANFLLTSSPPPPPSTPTFG